MLFVPYFVGLSPTKGGVSALKTGRREVLGSNPGRACRPSRLELSLVFSETCVNTGQDHLERPPTEGKPPIGPGPPNYNYINLINYLGPNIQREYASRGINSIQRAGSKRPRPNVLLPF